MSDLERVVRPPWVSVALGPANPDEVRLRAVSRGLWWWLVHGLVRAGLVCTVLVPQQRATTTVCHQLRQAGQRSCSV